MLLLFRLKHSHLFPHQLLEKAFSFSTFLVHIFRNTLDCLISTPDFWEDKSIILSSFYFPLSSLKPVSIHLLWAADVFVFIPHSLPIAISSSERKRAELPEELWKISTHLFLPAFLHGEKFLEDLCYTSWKIIKWRLALLYSLITPHVYIKATTNIN